MSQTLTPCSVAGCPALATKEDRCAIHGIGLTRHHVRLDKENILRCGVCQKLIRDGQWYHAKEGANPEHAHNCLEAKD